MFPQVNQEEPRIACISSNFLIIFLQKHLTTVAVENKEIPG